MKRGVGAVLSSHEVAAIEQLGKEGRGRSAEEGHGKGVRDRLKGRPGWKRKAPKAKRLREEEIWDSGLSMETAVPEAAGGGGGCHSPAPMPLIELLRLNKAKRLRSTLHKVETAPLRILPPSSPSLPAPPHAIPYPFALCLLLRPPHPHLAYRPLPLPSLLASRRWGASPATSTFPRPPSSLHVPPFRPLSPSACGPFLSNLSARLSLALPPSRLLCPLETFPPCSLYSLTPQECKASNLLVPILCFERWLSRCKLNEWQEAKGKSKKKGALPPSDPLLPSSSWLDIGLVRDLARGKMPEGKAREVASNLAEASCKAVKSIAKAAGEQQSAGDGPATSLLVGERARGGRGSRFSRPAGRGGWDGAAFRTCSRPGKGGSPPFPAVTLPASSFPFAGGVLPAPSVP